MSVLEILKEANLQDSYWGKLLLNAELLGVTEDLTKQAGNWPTCACGRLTYDIPRKEGKNGAIGCPLDETLYRLGMHFYDSLCYGSVGQTAKTLVEIEKRAQIVAAEYHQENSQLPTE